MRVASDIARPVSSLQLTKDPNRVRSFGGYNMHSVSTDLMPSVDLIREFVAEEARK